MAKVNQRTGEVVLNLDPEILTDVAILNFLDFMESVSKQDLLDIIADVQDEFEMPVFDFSLIHPDGTFVKADISHLYDQELLDSTGREIRARLSNDDES